MAQVEKPEAGPEASEPGGSPVRALRNVPAFDGLRAVLVLLIVWFHSELFLPKGAVPRGGFLGVDVFFVLSGFLITALLLNEQAARTRVHFGAFYRRRALRLLPVVAAFAVAHIAFAYLLHLNAGRERSGLLSLIFYYTNWYSLHGHVPLAFGHLWSLAVEEQFYLVWPLVVAVLSVRARFRTVVLVLTAAIVVVAIRRAVMYEHGVSWFRLFVGTDTRADTLLIGALLAHVWVRRPVPVRGLAVAGWVSVAFLAFCVLAMRTTTGFLYVGGFTLIAAAAAVVLLAILDSTWSANKLLSTRPLRAIGRVSYGLYVWHLLVFIWCVHYTSQWPAAPRFLFALAVTALTTFISWNLIEEPFLSWKRRLEQRDRTKASPLANGEGSAA